MRARFIRFRPQLSSVLINEMETGKALVLEVVDPNLLSATTSLPLAQFASVHKGPSAQTFEHDIDE